jgi:hypothetical protein
MSMVTSYTRPFHSSRIYRSQIRAFRSSTRRNADVSTDLLATKIDKLESDFSSLKADIKEQLAGYALSHKNQLSDMALDQEAQFSRFYSRCFFGVMGLTILLVGSSWILPMNETTRLDAEIKRRAIVQYGEKNEPMDLNSLIERSVLEGMKKASEGK